MTSAREVYETMVPPVVKFKKIHPDAKVPTRATLVAAGLDLYSVQEVNIPAGAYAMISLGFEIELPPGFEGQVRSRSGLASKYGVAVLNSPGTVDEDYRGEMKVILVNHGTGLFVVKPGDRVAQLVIARTELLPVIEVEELTESTRGANGFGSSGR